MLLQTVWHAPLVGHTNRVVNVTKLRGEIALKLLAQNIDPMADGDQTKNQDGHHLNGVLYGASSILSKKSIVLSLRLTCLAKNLNTFSPTCLPLDGGSLLSISSVCQDVDSLFLAGTPPFGRTCFLGI